MRPLPFIVLAAALAGCAQLQSELRSDISDIKSLIPGRASAEPQIKIPKIPGTFSEGLIVHRRVDHVRLKVFDTGEAIVAGDSVSEMKSHAARVHLSDPVFLIDHPTQGLILFDTGLSPEQPEGGLFKTKPGQDVVSQLKAMGISPNGIKWVINSHLHYDHAGMNSAFPRAHWLVDVREWRAARGAQGLDKNYVDLQTMSGLLPEVVDLSSAPQYGSFDHGLDLFHDGTVVLLDLSGHTAGNMGLWISMDEGPVLLTGGAAAVWDNYNDLALPVEPHEADVMEYKRRLREIHAIEQYQPDLMIIPSHDLSPMRLMQRSDVARVGG